VYLTVGYDEIPFWFISSRFPHLRYCKHNTDFPVGFANIYLHIKMVIAHTHTWTNIHKHINISWLYVRLHQGLRFPTTLASTGEPLYAWVTFTLHLLQHLCAWLTRCFTMPRILTGLTIRCCKAKTTTFIANHNEKKMFLIYWHIVYFFFFSVSECFASMWKVVNMNVSVNVVNVARIYICACIYKLCFLQCTFKKKKKNPYDILYI
jgi:hypothetical protein